MFILLLKTVFSFILPITLCESLKDQVIYHEQMPLCILHETKENDDRISICNTWLSDKALGNYVYLQKSLSWLNDANHLGLLI